MPVSYSAITELPYTDADSTLDYGNEISQFIEVWRPSEPTHGNLVFIHGGCWLSDYDIKHARPFMSALSKLGYQVFGIEYRRVGNGGGWPTSYQDIRSAIQQILKEPNVTAPNTAILGHSAGGHLALLAAADEQLPNTFASIIGLAAISDIVKYSAGSNSCEVVTEQFMGGSFQARTEAYLAANPVEQHFLNPVYLLHGTGDPIVDPKQSQALIRRAQSVYLQKEAGHFDWLHPNTPAFARVERLLKDVFNESN
ncbi:hypothetical protein BFR57_09935 [Idiomarina sp. MD25a]|nr:hypothetical protein BFR57_09935 [Idiomarina sp. MD25a]